MDEPIHITRWGDHGPRVVMVHGSAQGSAVGGERHFSAQARLAARGWQVIVPDRPGHGRSPAPGRGDDAEADGAWVAELLGDGGHLVGHSFGGPVALAAAALRPEAVRSLTVIEPAMQALAMHDPRVQQFGRGLMEAMTTATSPADRAMKFSALVRIPREIRGGESDPAEMARIGEGLTRMKLPSADVLRAQLEVVARTPIPLMVVTGGWNPGYEVVADAVAEAGAGTHVVIASEHHFPQLVSDAFNDVLVEFMTRA